MDSSPTVSIEPLEYEGYDLKFFRLPTQESEGLGFTYYTFDDSRLEKQPSSWDIIGIRRVGTLSMDVQLLYIDEEALDWPPFEALRDADGFLFLKLPHMQALLRFFEQYIDPDTSESKHRHSHFRLLDAEALHNYHVDRWRIESNVGNYYLYTPDEGVPSSQLISLIGFPQYMTEYDNSLLEFATFERRLLDDPQFDPFDGEWRGYMSFDQAAWQEFMALLKERA